MRAKSIPFDQQLQLIMECRNSGLSDYQWCQEHDINPGTFYNWVKRHRQKACECIPKANSRKEHPVPASRQEVVRIDPEQLSREPAAAPVLPEPEHIQVPAAIAMQPDPSYGTGHALEIILNGAVLRISNDVSPGLLAQTLQVLRRPSC